MRKYVGPLLLGLLVAMSTFRVAQAQQEPRAYNVSVTAQATTAAMLVSLEAPGNEGFRLSRVCVGSSPATAAAVVTVTVRRTTSQSSGGALIPNNGTGTTAVTTLVQKTGPFPGVARLGGTPGAAGPVLDQFSFVIGPIAAAGAAPICLSYDRMPAVQEGASRGLSIAVSAAGAGGLASGSISATIVMGQ